MILRWCLSSPTGTCPRDIRRTPHNFLRSYMSSPTGTCLQDTKHSSDKIPRWCHRTRAGICPKGIQDSYNSGSHSMSHHNNMRGTQVPSPLPRSCSPTRARGVCNSVAQAPLQPCIGTSPSACFAESLPRGGLLAALRGTRSPRYRPAPWSCRSLRARLGGQLREGGGMRSLGSGPRLPAIADDRAGRCASCQYRVGSRACMSIGSCSRDSLGSAHDPPPRRLRRSCRTRWGY